MFQLLYCIALKGLHLLGDGDRIIHCWRFLFLHYKAEGHTKYALEAFWLIADLEVMLSARRAHELKWNRTCSVCGGAGSNILLDLQMEHPNRAFKVNISRFSSHISEATALGCFRYQALDISVFGA